MHSKDRKKDSKERKKDSKDGKENNKLIGEQLNRKKYGED